MDFSGSCGKPGECTEVLQGWGHAELPALRTEYVLQSSTETYVEGDRPRLLADRRVIIICACLDVEAQCFVVPSGPLGSFALATYYYFLLVALDLYLPRLVYRSDRIQE